MYKVLKSILNILPKGLLYSLESNLRSIYSRLFYSGDQVYCSVCEQSRSKFKILEKGNLLCTNCGSLPRQRRLVSLLQEHAADQYSVLHLSPARCLNRKFRQLTNWNYHTSDYATGYLIDEVYDLTKSPKSFNQYDVIICYHVLEHIIEDQSAINNLHQLLKTGGLVFIQTPFKEGEIYENFSITTDAGRLEHFGQEDHVRIYSVNGLVNRLKQASFEIEILRFEQNEQNVELGLNDKETVLIAKKV